MWITLSGEGYLSVASFLSNLNIHVSALVSSAFLCPLSTCTTLGHERRPDQSSVAAHSFIFNVSKLQNAAQIQSPKAVKQLPA
jgi:hypothetical protein